MKRWLQADEANLTTSRSPYLLATIGWILLSSIGSDVFVYQKWGVNLVRPLPVSYRSIVTHTVTLIWCGRRAPFVSATRGRYRSSRHGRHTPSGLPTRLARHHLPGRVLPLPAAPTRVPPPFWTPAFRLGSRRQPVLFLGFGFFAYVIVVMALFLSIHNRDSGVPAPAGDPTLFMILVPPASASVAMAFSYFPTRAGAPSVYYGVVSQGLFGFVLVLYLVLLAVSAHAASGWVALSWGARVTV